MRRSSLLGGVLALAVAMAACDEGTLPTHVVEGPVDPLTAGLDASGGIDRTASVLARAPVGGINSLAPGSQVWDAVADFDAEPLGDAATLLSGGILFGERFAGQTVTTQSAWGPYDEISGTPTAPLTVAAGAPGQSLFNLTFGFGNNVLTGQEEFASVGEGSVSVLYPSPQAEVGFTVVGGDATCCGLGMTVKFYDASGGLIGSDFVPSPANGSHAWTTASGAATIAGLTIENTDAAGLAYDEFRYQSGPPPDDTPPEIAVVVSGTLGNGGWYTSDVTVDWTVTDDESDPVIVEGCADVTVTADTDDVTFTCTASSDGGEASASTTVKRDATDPTVTYSGNAGSYDASDEVAITCAAADATSGLAGDTCADVSGPAWSFGLGTSTFSATAEDNAGNVGEGSTSFTVAASFAGTCALVESIVSHAGVANSLCAKLEAAERSAARGNTNSRNGQLAAFIQEVEAQRDKKVPSDGADLLILLANALMA